MHRLFFFLLGLCLFMPITTQAASDVDLGFARRDPILFSEETLIAGQTVRLYARVSNFGDVDVSGFVTFYQGSTQIESSQTISVRAGGAEEEVYVDFVVPKTPFNIRAQITNTTPEDQDASNNTTLTSLFTPVIDTDGDEVPDDADNCPTNANSSQKDNDLDGLGDACDDDDDNDGWSDVTEKTNGTDATKADTDGDGVTDPSDYAPTDASITQKPIEVAIVAPEPPETPSTPTPPQNPETPSTPETPATPGTPETLPTTDAPPARTALHLSPKAIFTYSQPQWNTYHFAAVDAGGANGRYAWDFGDGVTSSRGAIDHTYRSFGDYTVTLTVTSEDGQISRDSTTVSISFFNIGNPYLKLLLAILFVLFVISTSVFVRVYGSEKQGRANETIRQQEAKDEPDAYDHVA